MSNTPSPDRTHRPGDPPGWLKPFASLRLTVTLFALMIFLIFAGTLAQTEQGIWAVLDQYFRTLLAWIDIRPLTFGLIDSDFAFPYPGGWLIGGLLLINLMAAHIIRFALSWKRAGIMMIHSGLIMLLLSEAVTGLFAEESQMTIAEGQTVNFAEDVRELELAIVDTSGEETDRVIAVPESMLKEGKTLTDDRLPFPVTIRDWMPNAEVRRAGPFEDNPATVGIGEQVLPIERPRADGLETRIDHPAAYVEVGPQGDRATFLVSSRLVSQEIPGTDYEIALRFKRIYKPYLIHLHDLKHEQYLGTEIPKNFESVVQLVDPFNNVDRQARIYMNHPLRYGGDTLYQFQILGDDQYTVLQVVNNPGWLIPYVSCALVGLGLVYHFVLSLVTFSGKRRKKSAASASASLSGSGAVGGMTEPAASAPSTLQAIGPHLLAGVLVGIAAATLCYPLTQDREYQGFDLGAFSRLPVVDQGRIKPIGSLSDHALMAISKRTAIHPEEGEPIRSERWLLDVMVSFFDAESAEAHRVFRIESESVRDALDLPARQGFRYAWGELLPKLPELSRQIDMAMDVDPEQRTLFQRKLLELGNQVELYMSLARWERPHAVPPTETDAQWQPFLEAMRAGRGDQRMDPALEYLGTIKNAWVEGNPQRFNSAVAGYREAVKAWAPEALDSAQLESLYNRINPLVSSMGLYVLAFVLAVAGWLIAPRWLHTAAMWLIIFLFGVHTAALLVRMDLMDRPWVFVTNLYSSAVFCGWGAILTAIVLEWFWRNGIGTVCGAVIGFVTLLVAYHLEQDADGETMEMLQAVLDTNFWLATHVTTVTLGYSATFLAGVLGIIYIIRRLMPNFSSNEARSLTRMTYGTICFALLLSFIGTVLGGIWADQSWGRFWGWDPKENGALIIVIWNALILHARFGGMIKPRGIAVAAVFGNVVTAWSWFGTNMLGVGLHSYGFMEGAPFWLLAFIVSQTAIMALGLLPGRESNGPTPRPRQ